MEKVIPKCITGAVTEAVSSFIFKHFELKIANWDRDEKGKFAWSWVKLRLSVFASSLQELAGELSELSELT